MTERIVTEWTTASPSTRRAPPVWQRPRVIIAIVAAIAIGAAGFFLLSGSDDADPTIDSRSFIDEDAGNQFIGL